jgi:hypothetical protein
VRRWLMGLGAAVGWALAINLFWGCGMAERGVGVTGNRDYTISIEVAEGMVHVGDQTPMIVRLKRTDNSNLDKGMVGDIVITLSDHGRVDPSSVRFAVPDHLTAEIVQIVVYTAVRSGVAQARASFLDATAQVKILISGLNP